MPKSKMHESISGRFRQTMGGKGKLRRMQQGKSHLRRERNKRAKRQFDYPMLVEAPEVKKRVRRLALYIEKKRNA